MLPLSLASCVYILQSPTFDEHLACAHTVSVLVNLVVPDEAKRELEPRYGCTGCVEKPVCSGSIQCCCELTNKYTFNVEMQIQYRKSAKMSKYVSRTVHVAEARRDYELCHFFMYATHAPYLSLIRF